MKKTHCHIKLKFMPIALLFLANEPYAYVLSQQRYDMRRVLTILIHPVLWLIMRHYLEEKILELFDQHINEHVQNQTIF